MLDDLTAVQDDKPILLLDPHQPSSTPDRPFKKGWLHPPDFIY